MTGKNFLPLFRMSVYSIARKWDTLPKLTVINDGSVSDDEIRRHIKFWKGELYIQPYADSVNYHMQKGRDALVKFSENHIFGIKMAVILHHAELDPVLWVDSDILFFKDMHRYIPSSKPDFCCGVTEDWYRAYDPAVLEILPDNRLGETPGMNAGMLYAFGKAIYEQFRLEQLLNQLHPNYHFFTEQTLFAYIASNSFGILWDQSIVKNTSDDNKEFRAKNPATMIARHYTSHMRLLFWRDAMFDL